MSEGIRPSNWRRNLAALWLAEVIALVGITAVVPFLPQYIQQLGVTGAGQVELWSGLVYSAHAVAIAIMAPVWGSLADRFGRKAMMLRAMMGSMVTLGAMAFVGDVRQLLALRIAQGASEGIIAAAYTLVATGTPIEQCGYALGLMQVGVYVGASLGPAVGGVTADLWGYRSSFALTVVLMVVAIILVLVMVRDTPRSGARAKQAGQENLLPVLASQALVIALGLRLLVSLAYQIVSPMMSLFVPTLLEDRTRVASVVGAVTSVSMAGTAAGAALAGRLGQRLGTRRALALALVSSAVCYLLQAMVRSTSHLLALQALAGFAAGGVAAVLATVLAQTAPEGRQGTVFGLDTTMAAVGNGIGPMLGAAIAASWGLRRTFVASSLCFGLAAVLAAVTINALTSRR